MVDPVYIFQHFHFYSPLLQAPQEVFRFPPGSPGQIQLHSMDGQRIKPWQIGRISIQPASDVQGRHPQPPFWEIQHGVRKYYQPKQGTVYKGDISGSQMVNGGLGHVLLLVFRFVRR